MSDHTFLDWDALTLLDFLRKDVSQLEACLKDQPGALSSQLRQQMLRDAIARLQAMQPKPVTTRVDVAA